MVVILLTPYTFQIVRKLKIEHYSILENRNFREIKLPEVRILGESNLSE